MIFSFFGFWSAVITLVIACAASVLLYLLLKGDKRYIALIICLAAVVSSVSYCVKTVREYVPALALADDESHTVSGVLSEYEIEAYEGTSYYIVKNASVDSHPVDAEIRVSSPLCYYADIGDSVRFDNVSIYTFSDFSQMLNNKANGIYVGAYTRSNVTAEKCNKHPIGYYFEEIRNYITKTLRKNMPLGAAAVADAMLTGRTTKIANGTLVGYRYSGLAHLFAVSGFHLTLWSSLIVSVLSKIIREIKPKKYIIFAADILFVLFYMTLVGFTKSVIRAGIMITIVEFGKLIGKSADSLNSLFVALGVILIINPFAAMSVSLLMSFLSVLGLIIFAPAVQSDIKKLCGKIPVKFLSSVVSYILSVVSVSVIAGMFTLPVSAFAFGYYSNAAPVTSVLCLTTAELAIFSIGVAVIIAPLSVISKPMFFLGRCLIDYINFITDKISRLPYAVTHTSSAFSLAAVGIITVLTSVFLLIFISKPVKRRRVFAASVACVAVLSVLLCANQSASVEISVADVGNGISVIVKSGKVNLLVGCGGNKNSDYKLTNLCDGVNTRRLSLVVIPRNTDTQSFYAYRILGGYECEEVIISDEKYPPYLIERLPDDAYITDYASVSPDGEMTVTYVNSDSFSGVRIESEDISCTVIFKPTVDFSAVPDSWRTGDLLITRQKLPRTDLSGFDCIFVSGNAEIEQESDRILSTASDGTLTYIKSWGGREEIYADNR